MDPRWYERSLASADAGQALAWLVGIPFVAGFGLLLAWGEMYQRMHASDAVCSESWARPGCRFDLAPRMLLPWIAISMVGVGLATLGIVRSSRTIGSPSVGWIGVAAGLSSIVSLGVFTFGPTWSSTAWAYGSYVILVASATRLIAASTGRRLTPGILLVGLPLLLFVCVVLVLQAMA
jgi:hypothetical protein